MTTEQVVALAGADARAVSAAGPRRWRVLACVRGSCSGVHGPGGAPIQQHPFAMVWATAREKAGLETWVNGPHQLRHHFASVLIASGASVKVVQRRLGHASAKTTLDTYGHLFPDDEDATWAAIDGRLGSAMRGDATRRRKSA